MIELLTDTNLDLDILYEPFYAEIIGRAIARSPQSKEFLQELRSRLPLALVEAIRCFGTPTSDYHQAIVEQVKKWANSKVATGFVTESVLGSVCWSLLETNSPVVLEITEKFPKWPLVLLSRFRNGCAVSGVRYYCVIHSQNYFVPASRDDLRDQAIEQAKHYHTEKLLEELKQLLISCTATDGERRGALALAGFLGFTELQDEMKTCWTLATDKTQVLSEAIWAAFQGSVTKYGKLLGELIAYWDSLPDDQYGYGDSPKAIVTADLRSALCHGTSDEVISYLIAQSDIHKSLHPYINYVLRCINTPDAIEFVVRNAADPDISNYPDRLSQATVMLDFDLEWNSGFSDSPRLSRSSRNRLKALWKEPKNDEFLKEIAFHVWEIGIEQDEIHTLKEIPSNSPLYRRALRKRAELEDRSVIPNFLSLLSEENYGFSVVQYVWCDEIMLELKRYLNTFSNSILKDFSGESIHEHNIVSWLLTRISENDAETLLYECWSHLGYSPLFIQTALYVGTPKCLELVADSISKCTDDIPIFKYFSDHFHLNKANSKKYLDSGKLQKIVQNLLPYLDRLDDFQLWQLAEACKEFKIVQWSQQHLLPRLTDEFRRRCHPSDDDLLQALDKFAADKDGEWRVTHWLEEFDKRYDLQSRILSLVDCWLAFNPTVKGLQIAAACIQAVGTRQDLSILEQCTIEGSPDEIARIKESTRFAVYRRSLD
jgi:hypothetical protein